MRPGKQHRLDRQQLHEQLRALHKALKSAESDQEMARLLQEISDTEMALDRLGADGTEVSPDEETSVVEQLSGPNDPVRIVRPDEVPRLRVTGDELARAVLAIVNELRQRRSAQAAVLEKWYRTVLKKEVK